MKAIIIWLILIILALTISVSAEKILHIGDSHTAGTYGDELYDLLTSVGAELTSYGCVSASPNTYLKGGSCDGGLGSNINKNTASYTAPKMDSLLTSAPSIVIVSLGANFFNNQALSSDETIKSSVSELSEKVYSSGAKCYWIGPPSGDNKPKEKLDRLYEMISASLNHCTFIDSREFYAKGADGHFSSGSSQAKSWAKKVFDQIRFSSSSAPKKGSAQAGITSGSSSGTVSGTSSGSGYLSSTSQQIDEVWASISMTIGNSQSAGKIWDGSRWVDKIVPPAPISSTFYFGNLGNNPQVKKDLAAGLYTGDFLQKLEQLSRDLSINSLHLLAVMSFETGHTFSPSIKNPGSSATGLIQFLEGTATKLGTTTSDLAKMTSVQQLDYVKLYYQKFGIGIRSNNLGDVAMIVIWPQAVGKEDDYVLFSVGEGAYGPNSGLDTNKDEKITRQEYLSKVEAQGYGMA
ncbi:MAG: SGNH/GDSL hydrolase family protein [Candidatus Woesearchaeota archaeon]